MRTYDKLNLDRKKIAECRAYAKRIGETTQTFIDAHTTVAVERTVLRLCGVDGIDRFDVPIPNLMVDDVNRHGDLSRGVSVYLASALKAIGLDLDAFVSAFADGKATLCGHPLLGNDEARRILKPYLDRKFARIDENRATRDAYVRRFGKRDCEIYLIVATGNIYEDVVQAQAAAEAGADIIAVIRSTGQSLLDFVPYGATTEGFGGTFATQENFRIMRKALDETSEKVGRYIKLVNYASGLCMPEIAAMGALERLDVMLNDSMYGIIFRDINMRRTLVDQHFSRSLNAYAGIVINTGEDNYLTTSDAVDKAHTVLASQFINERFAIQAGLPPEQTGLGHAFEIDPAIGNGFLYEIAQAEMAREIFPDCPLKYMPPTKHSTGNIFQTHAMDTLFNTATTMTGQSIHLLGMMTEAIHTPFLADRHLAVENAKMVQTTMGAIYDELRFAPDGIVVKRAHQVLEEARAMLEKIAGTSLFDALERGDFADIRRSRDGGKGLEGVVAKHPDYMNAAFERLREGRR
ncbi:MAG: lysine 5,6-aminomutase subunit alpha [Candidatus Izemoplasmatales bacterium]